MWASAAPRTTPEVAAPGVGPTGLTAPGPGGLAGWVRADDIPVAHTPPGGWRDTMPPPVLAGCDEPLVAGAPDLRGLWEVVEVTVDGSPVPDHPAVGAVQRIEQCGDRLVVTAGGVIHDMRCDGTAERGVNDVAADLRTPIRVVATYEDGVHVLRPVGTDIRVTRHLDGDEMIWVYGPLFVARCRRLDGPAAGGTRPRS